MRAIRKPSYLRHKASGQARVRVNGRDHYLGPYGSPESQKRYDRLLADWFARHGETVQQLLTIDELAILYLDFAAAYYRKSTGEQTSEVGAIRHSLRALVRIFGTCRVNDFGPRKLKQVRESLVDSGYCRSNVNRMVGRIKRLFEWGVSEEYVAPSIASALAAVKGLRKGRTDALESDPVRPVDDAVVEATLPHLPEMVAAMVRLQLLTGARPGEICSLRPRDIHIGKDGVWRYTPESHKTEHHGRERRIHLGPQAQQILRPFLARPDANFCFSPQESEMLRSARRRARRKSPLTPSQTARRPQANRERAPLEKYTSSSYRRAIQRGCEVAFGMPRELRRIPKSLPARERKRRQEQARNWRKEHCWTPSQLRHTRATILRERYGIEAAQVVLGHADPRTTEIYAERDFARAASIMREIG